MEDCSIKMFYNYLLPQLSISAQLGSVKQSKHVLISTTFQNTLYDNALPCGLTVCLAHADSRVRSVKFHISYELESSNRARRVTQKVKSSLS